MSRWTCVVAGVLLLGGCSGDPEPRFEAEPSPSASVSAAPTESVSPAAETAEDFIRRWFDASTAMQMSGDSAAFRAMSSSCKTCEKVADTVDRTYAKGGYIRGGAQSVQTIERKATDGTTSLYVVDFTAAPTQYRNTSTAKVRSFAGGDAQMEITVSADKRGYVVLDYVNVV